MFINVAISMFLGGYPYREYIQNVTLFKQFLRAKTCVAKASTTI